MTNRPVPIRAQLRRNLIFTTVSFCLFSSVAVGQTPYASICQTCDSTRTIARRLPPPQGFARVTTDANSYAAYLRHLPLTPEGTDANDWRGQLALTSAEVAAVLDWRLLGSVEQCADIAIRLLAEHARHNGVDQHIRFRSLSGQTMGWVEWLQGHYSLNADATRIAYTSGAKRTATDREFDRYLTFVMSYANTASMLRDWPTVAYESIEIGDVLIQPFCTGRGSGHLSLIVDACVDDTGNRLYLFADGYTPARTPVIRQRMPGSPETAWMTTEEYLNLMSQFGSGTFHRFPGWGQ